MLTLKNRRQLTIEPIVPVMVPCYLLLNRTCMRWANYAIMGLQVRPSMTYSQGTTIVKVMGLHPKERTITDRQTSMQNEVPRLPLERRLQDAMHIASKADSKLSRATTPTCTCEFIPQQENTWAVNMSKV